MLLDLLTVAVLALVGTRLVQSAVVAARSRDLRDRAVALVRGLRVHHFLMALPVLGLVVVAAGLLLSVPGLNWGWWTALGGTGKVIVGTNSKSSLGFVQWLAPVLFVTLLIPLLPLFAEREEHMFREGAEGWSTARRVRRAVEFGLVHLVMGIPIGVALALSIGGGYFTWAYMRGYRKGGRAAAVSESTRSHLAYNLTIIGVVVMGLLLAACSSSGGSSGSSSRPAARAGSLTVMSSAFAPGGAIPEKFSCQGDNVPPPLSVTGVPSGAAQLAVALTDPDAPGGTFVHWILVGLPGRDGAIDPAAGQAASNSANEKDYTGMCPPTGSTHHYVFEVFALKAPAALEGSPLNKVRGLRADAVAWGTLTGTYRR